MTSQATNPLKRFTPIILLLITAIGAFFRLYQIDSLPPAASFDAAQYGLDALDILDGARPLFLATNFGREVLFSYFVALIYMFSGSGTLGIHLASALIGTATIPAVYLAARELFAEDEQLRLWVPLLGALVAAISYWHINYSRAGLRVIWVPFFAALITAFLWRGLTRSSRLDFAAAGLLLGLSQYTYQAARILPVLVAAGFLFSYVSRRTFTRRDALDVVLTFGLALLIFAPLGIFAIEHPAVFNDRLRQTALLSQEQDLAGQLDTLIDQGRRALSMFFIKGDPDPLYTIPGRPSLNPFLAAAFITGLVAALWRWRVPAFAYLLTWLMLLTAPAMIADQAATAKRALGAFPAVAVLIGIGLVLPFLMLNRRLHFSKRWQPLLYGLVVCGILSITAVITFNDYFLRWGRDPGLIGYYQRDHTELGLAASRAAEDMVLISPFPADHPAIQLNSNRLANLRSYDGHRCLLIPPTVDRGATYLIVPGETETSLAQLQAIFPEGVTTPGPLRPDRAEPFFEAFSIAEGSSPQLSLPESVLLNWENEIALLDISIAPPEAAPGGEVTVTLTYQALDDLQFDYTAYIHLLHDEQLVAQTDTAPCGAALATSTWRRGDIVRDRIKLQIPGDANPGSFDLVAGFYTWPDIVNLDLVGDHSPVIARLEIR